MRALPNTGTRSARPPLARVIVTTLSSPDILFVKVLKNGISSLLAAKKRNQQLLAADAALPKQLLGYDEKTFCLRAQGASVFEDALSNLAVDDV